MVGVDVGGTKTHIISSGGSSNVDIVVPSTHWRHGALFDHVDNFDRLSAAILDAVGEAPLATVVGAHGVDSIPQRLRATALLDARLPGRVEVMNDAILLAPAMGLPAAICVIAGTGSAVVGSDADGRLIAADGYGWLVADDASAPGLARGGLVALLRTVDREGPAALDDPLGRRFLSAFDAADHVELSLRFQAAAGEHAWGSFAPQVFAAVAQGSPIARRVVGRAATHLADLVMAVRARGARGDDVIAAGGVITAQPLLSDGLRDELRLRDPSLRLHILDTAPAIGALALARLLAETVPPISPHATPDGATTS